MTLPLRKDLEGFEPYGAPQIDVPVILNVNENPYAPAPEVVRDIADAAAQAALGANRYPDRDFMELRRDLAAYLLKESGVEIPAEQIWAGNGSNEIMLHLLTAFGGPGRIALGFDPTYSMYPEYARDSLTEWRTLPRRADFTIDRDAALAAIAELSPSVVLLASPNNPTGTALSLAEIEAIAEAARGAGPEGTDTVVVIDEAYGEFRRADTPSALALREVYPHLVVTRTMSKAFGMAGLRLGYLAAQRPVVDALTVVRLPYHLSAFTQAVARAALSHSETLMAQIASLRAERDQLVEWLVENGFSPAPSDANFVLFGPLDDRRKVWDELLARGILIREVGPPGHLRVTVGSPEEMAAFRTALLEVT
ncbi:histidinol phosphate aminotransferase apoenzyme [Ruaniaceae bacterium KH17]|nr:histidinol phosphate aminotransferase apoenzyme [Ruaniaceae bacterium KH17]